MTTNPTTNDAPLLAVEDLTAGYGDQRVLDGVSFAVERGEILGVIGATGSGKSTVLRCIVGLLSPTQGRVRIRGRDVAESEGEQRDAILQDVGMAFQEAALLNSMTTEENVALPIREHWRVHEETALMLARMHLSRVGLAGAGRKLPSELSGGMRKRAGIARAMALEPSLLLLDEPTSGLDPTTARAIDELVLSLRKQRADMGVVVVSHEVASMRTIADRVVMLEAGRVIASGSLQKVEASPAPRVQAFFERALVEGQHLESLAEALEISE